MRLLPLAHALPEAVFLVMVRDEVDNAHSLLESHWQRNRNYAQWVFHETPNMEQLRQLPLHERTIEYIRTNRMIIERHSRQIGETRFHWVSYEELCGNPCRVLNEVSRFLARNGVRLRDRGVKKAPFVVLIGANMPSILSEISFLTNPSDEHLLKKPDYRQKIAEALLRGINQYRDNLGGVKLAEQSRTQGKAAPPDPLSPSPDQFAGANPRDF